MTNVLGRGTPTCSSFDRNDRHFTYFFLTLTYECLEVERQKLIIEIGISRLRLVQDVIRRRTKENELPESLSSLNTFWSLTLYNMSVILTHKMYFYTQCPPDIKPVIHQWKGAVCKRSFGYLATLKEKVSNVDDDLINFASKLSDARKPEVNRILQESDAAVTSDRLLDFDWTAKVREVLWGRFAECKKRY